VNETTHDHIRELLPAYALDALDPAEARSVADHLRECAECTQELAMLHETLGLLAFSAPAATPSPAVRAALFARVEQIATTTTNAAASTSTPPTHVATGPDAPHALAAYRGRSRGVRVALAAFAAVLVLGLLGWGTLTQLRLNAERQQLAAERERNAQLATQTSQLAFVNTLLNDPNAAFPVSGPAVADYGLPAAGYIYVEPTSTVGLMLTYWLPKINADQRFQVWLVTPDGQRDSGGLFTADARGNAHVIINAPAPFAKYKSVGVTVEPATGSPGPTSPRVCGGEIR
jgi:anti-sigma-K factor RskA